MLDQASDETRAFEIGPLSAEYGLWVAGELDLLTAEELASALRELDRDEQVALDLSELTFVDSMGLHVLLSYARTFDASRPLVIANPPPVVARLFDLVSAKDLRTICIRVDDTVEEEPAWLTDELDDLARRASKPALEPDAAA